MENRINILDSINWNFNYRGGYRSERPHPINCRKYFSYPATFIPEIPYTLIEALSDPGDMVLDPFGGIGTTFFQALIQKRKAYSFDNNLIASEINQAMFLLLDPSCDLEKAKDRLIKYCNDYNKEQKYFLSLSDLRRELRGWYAEDTYNQIAYLIVKYDHALKELGEIEYSLFKICLSDILTTVCSQKRGWAYIADNVKPKAEDLKEKSAIDRFVFCIRRIVDDFCSYRQILGTDLNDLFEDLRKKETVRNIDFINYDFGDEREFVDLVVTSPPYPKMIDYVKSQRLIYYLFNKEYNEKLGTEIGARYYRNKKDSLDLYLNSMKKCNDQLAKLIKQNGILCFILPDYTHESPNTGRKEVIDMIVKDCETKGFIEQRVIGRYIPGTNRANNMKWASLKNENIYIFTKGKK